MEKGAKYLQVFVGSDGFSIRHDAFEQAFWHNDQTRNRSLNLGKDRYKSDQVHTRRIEPC